MNHYPRSWDKIIEHFAFIRQLTSNACLGQFKPLLPDERSMKVAELHVLEMAKHKFRLRQSNLRIKEVKEGMLRTFHCGSSRTPETVYFVQHGFLMLFFLLQVSLIEPLAEYYSQHSDTDSFSIWAEKVNGLIPKFVELTHEYARKTIAEKAQFDKELYKLTEKKMRLEEIKIRLSGSGNYSDE